MKLKFLLANFVLPSFLVVSSSLGFLWLAKYSQQIHSTEFVMEKLAEYDDDRTRPYIPRPNIVTDPGVIYQSDLGALYDTKPVVLIMKDGKKK